MYMDYHKVFDYLGTHSHVPVFNGVNTSTFYFCCHRHVWHKLFKKRRDLLDNYFEELYTLL